ncbi:hypothetical protein D3C85_16110 [compost metagenome]
MDVKLFLVKSVSLLFLESQLEGYSSGNPRMIREILSEIKLPETIGELGDGRNTLSNLRTTLLWMLNEGASQRYDVDSTLQRLRLNTNHDDVTYKSFEKLIRRYPDETVVRKHINDISREIRRYKSRDKLHEIIKKASYTLSFREAEVEDWDSFVLQTAQDLLSVDLETEERVDPAFITSVNFNDKDSVTAAFEDMHRTMSTDGILKFPIKAMNKLMGVQGGPRRGEFGLVNALPGNNKSGTLLDMFIGVCIFNDPFLFDPSKKPLVLLYSTEDDVPVIIQKIYVILKQRETGVAQSIKGVTPTEAADYVMGKLQERGWFVELHRIKGSAFTYAKYIKHLEQYKAKGFEVCASFVDYLAMYSKDGCASGSTGDDLQDLYKRVREYTAPEKILQVTAHQLSTQAKEEKRMNPTKFIRDMPGGGYYQGCKKLDTEVDWEFYVNKQVVNNGTYLEYLWGKHRGVVEPTPEAHKYFVMKFLEDHMYGVPYDMDLEEDLSYKIVGGRPSSAGGGMQWNDIDEMNSMANAA